MRTCKQIAWSSFNTPPPPKLIPNIFGLLGYALRVEKSTAGQPLLKLSRNSFEKVPYTRIDGNESVKNRLLPFQFFLVIWAQWSGNHTDNDTVYNLEITGDPVRLTNHAYD